MGVNMGVLLAVLIHLWGVFARRPGCEPVATGPTAAARQMSRPSASRRSRFAMLWCQPSPGPADPASASRSLLRTRITSQAVARARTAIAAAGMKAVEMPWASTSCPHGAGS